LSRKIFISIFYLFSAVSVIAQESDSAFAKKGYFLHAQATIVSQYKPSFSAPYSGENSFHNTTENATSYTSTLYLGAKLNKNSFFYATPELAGGSGLSKVLGIGDAPNGETFRVTTTDPKIYVARAYLKKIITIDTSNHSYLNFNIGKVSLADFFDNNKYSHDPRTQFLNWGLMSNGAWDYPANTKGYTPAFIIEYFKNNQEYRIGYALMPTTPNGAIMDWNIKKSGGLTAEFVQNYTLSNNPGAIRFLMFLNKALMGNYVKGLNTNIEATRNYSNTKLGWGLNIEQALGENLGGFFKTSWNDGQNETWAFTEIDNSISFGLSANSEKWGQKSGKLGLAFVSSGLSKEHQQFLNNGGLGFTLGDGKLNYDRERVIELYYQKYFIDNKLAGTIDYQNILNPGYNMDRKGPVNIFSIRLRYYL
jgi:high affinity Mn2+ porin